MAAWVYTDVQTTCPEFAAVSSTIIDAFIALVVPQIDSVVFDVLTKVAGTYLTAHMLKIAGYGNGAAGATSGLPGAGAVTGATVGQVSVNFAALGVAGTQGFAASLGLTKYGLEYIRICRMVGPFVDVL